MKIIVEIDLKNHTIKDYEKYKDEFHPVKDKSLISVDHTYLRIDPTDDSYYLFKLIEILR